MTAAGWFTVRVAVDGPRGPRAHQAGHLVGRLLGDGEAAGQGGSVAQAGLPLENSLK